MFSFDLKGIHCKCGQIRKHLHCQLVNIVIIIVCHAVFQERIQDDCPSLPLPLCQSLTSIVQQLIGHPPDLHVVMPICDFLLLVHAAANTFVFQTPNSFYFTNKWGKFIYLYIGFLITNLSSSHPN